MEGKSDGRAWEVGGCLNIYYCEVLSASLPLPGLFFSFSSSWRSFLHILSISQITTPTNYSYSM